MRPLYPILGWFLTTQLAAVAQTPAAAPALPTSFRSGSYLLHDATTWQSGKLLYNERELLVSDATHKQKEPLTLPAAQVGLFVVGRDTFDVVRNLVMPAAGQPLATAFARRLYRRAGYQVAEYVAYPPKPEAAVAYKLLYRRPAEVAAVLPPNPRLFRLALLAVVRDYVPLARQLELDPTLLPEQLPDLLTAYQRWQTAQPANAQNR